MEEQEEQVVVMMHKMQESFDKNMEKMVTQVCELESKMQAMQSKIDSLEEELAEKKQGGEVVWFPEQRAKIIVVILFAQREDLETCPIS